MAGAYDQKDAAINSVHIDRERKEILAFFHAERPTGGLGFSGTVRFYATVGLVSGDRNLDFRKACSILSGVPEDPRQALEDGSGGSASHRFAWTSTGERGSPLPYRPTCIDPRTEVASVGPHGPLQGPDDGRPGKWSKYYNGSFSEPGLGGGDAARWRIAGGERMGTAEMRKYVMAGNRDGIRGFTSDDGIHYGRSGGMFVECTMSRSSASRSPSTPGRRGRGDTEECDRPTGLLPTAPVVQPAPDAGARSDAFLREASYPAFGSGTGGVHGHRIARQA
ncbi:MAG: hypothetical protein U0790_00385 [Isosphaeraceae bacterium]